MFIDLMTGIFAFVNFGCDIATEKLISKQIPPYKGLTLGYDKYEPCFPEKDNGKDLSLDESPVFKTPYQKQAEYEKAVKDNAAKEKDAFIDWIVDHSVMLSEVLSKGSSVILYEDIAGVDIDKLIDFLFSQDNVESCEKVNEGIYIVTRGGGC